MSNTAKGPVKEQKRDSGSAADPDNLAGTDIVFCRVEQLIGEGTFGRVYSGTTPPPTRKKVAIKFLKQELCGQNPEVLKRFEREVSLAGKLAHENIASIITSGVHQPTGQWYMVMEFVYGEPLDVLLDRYRDGLPVPMAAGIVTQALRAIKHAHEQDVVHRDLKPENIMVKVYAEDHLFVKVLDFGVAHITDPTVTGGEKLTMERALIGTPHYMSPEVARGLPDIDARSDLYSLGVILYELLTGQPPFNAETPMEVVTMQIRDTPPRPGTIRPGIPRKLEDLVMMLLAKEREKRPKTALAAIRALESAMHDFRESMAKTMVPTMVQQPKDVSSMLATFQKDGRGLTEITRTVVKRSGVRVAGLGLAAAALLALIASVVNWNGGTGGGVRPAAERPSKVSGSGQPEEAESRQGRETGPAGSSAEAPATDQAAEPEVSSAKVFPPPSSETGAGDRTRLRDDCLAALRAQSGFVAPCDRYLALSPEDGFVRNTRDFLRRRGKR